MYLSRNYSVIYKRRKRPMLYPSQIREVIFYLLLKSPESALLLLGIPYSAVKCWMQMEGVCSKTCLGLIDNGIILGMRVPPCSVFEI